jgi:hypothetical protein
MNTFSCFLGLTLSLTLANTLAHAQQGDPNLRSPQEHEVDSAHDRGENDPSRGHRYKLKRPISQTTLIFTGVNSHINANIDNSLSRALFDYNYVSSSDLLKDPEYTKFYQIHSHRYTPQLEYGPTTVNSDHEYQGISDRKYGYCWGYSTMVRYFTVLGFFDPKLPRISNIEFYKNKIDQVLAGEAAVIPGYANLREFTLDPQIEMYLKLNAMELWRSRAVSTSSLNIFRKATDSLNYSEVETLLSKLEKKIARGELPKILFSSLIPAEKVLGLNTDIHVVLAYKVERLSKGRARIHLWDINFYTETLMRAPKYLEITEQHGIRYEPWYEPTKTYAEGSALVSRVTLAPEDNAENMQMLKSLKSFCENRTTLKYCVENSKN